MMYLPTGLALALLLVVPTATGFTGPSLPTRSKAIDTTRANPALLSPLFHHDDHHHQVSSSSPEHEYKPMLHKLSHRWQSLQRRLQPATQLDEPVQLAGLFGSTVKKVHDPKTYLALALLAGFRYDWCFRNPFFWFGVAFCVKWYRARYVFKIPVWDRQPNWNNVITSKEQEKDLKAFTCKNCGSTIFIAKTREFFFEGSTGIGGLGCFSCGEKGKDNFVMDRERIVEDVADVDDYFDYEQPLDFVSRAERRKVLQEAKGDEELANKLLIERAGGSTEEETTTDNQSSTEEEATASDDNNSEEEENPVEVESIEDDDAGEETTSTDDEEEESASQPEESPVVAEESPVTEEEEPPVVEEKASSVEAADEEETVESIANEKEVEAVTADIPAETPKAPRKTGKKKKKKPTPSVPAPPAATESDASDDELDILGI
ncbi:expressed unknown protein [Seminavis robusta]|uniref:Uncharacterized protein n=1 Tax=Seminavis robusta TaxID=568900 RepID=A0A9N8H590_9STRA|nr:expressed unknown protein [Seminavis robusta]|eukprot:Sro107_g053870.1 n/a (433) ;mRNA; r:59910-61312